MTGRQPFLHDAVIALRAPTQVWSRADGDMHEPIDGIYHGDRRFVSAVALHVAGHPPEPIASGVRGASAVVFDAVLRHIDDETPDPHVRLTRERSVTAGRMTERIIVRSVSAGVVRAVTAGVGAIDIVIRLTPDFRTLGEVKSGGGRAFAWRATAGASTSADVATTTVAADPASFTVTAPGASITSDADEVVLTWRVEIADGGEVAVTWDIALDDPGLVVSGVETPADWSVDTAGLEPRLRRWVAAALDDLDALRLALPDRPADVFLAAGAPWFLTLFGRDSLWAARMLLPLDRGLAASTLRVLARVQGTRDDPATEEEPGKIAHELRAGEFTMPGEGIVLPPLYFGTVDATALWVCLLVDAHRAGLPDVEVRDLLPNLRAALDWITRSAGADGFLSYIDRTGRGLANQGWKDSGDSIQWRDGTLAEGPIALCEVQGYAFEAAVGAAALLDALGEPGGDDLRTWADALRSRFADRFWVSTPEGRYPSIALDRDGRAVDTLTSNIGHLLGTGLLGPAEEQEIAQLLVGPTMSSGFGIRTMSSAAGGYWPLSYHGGAVWAHDSAIVAHGMARAGLLEEAGQVVDGLLAAAEGFGFRMPELHSGDARGGAAFSGGARGGGDHDGGDRGGGDHGGGDHGGGDHGGGDHGGGDRGGGDRDRHLNLAARPSPVPYPAACRPQAWSAAAAITCLEIVRRR